MKPENVLFFDCAADFRAWLDANHATADAQWVGLWKKGSGRAGLTYAEAVVEALCFGWIDGQTNRIDDASVTVRFSRRRTGSNWSSVNIQRAKDLVDAGRMHPAGLLAFEARRDPEPGTYSYETRPADLPAELEAAFRANGPAWDFFAQQPPGYRRSMTWWIVSAKKDETRYRRLDALIAASEARRRVDALNLPKLGTPTGASSR